MATTTKKEKLGLLIIGTKANPVRFSYLTVFEPRSIDGNSEKKFSVSLIIPKKDKELVAKIKEKIEAVRTSENAKQKWGKIISIETIMGNPKTAPLRDGDSLESEDEVYKGAFYVNAKNSSKPGIVDENLQEIIDPTQIYSGCYGRASVEFYPCNSNGNKGIAVSLNNVQFIKDGEQLGGRTKAEDDFADEDSEL